jgi:hypothetical protein
VIYSDAERQALLDKRDCLAREIAELTRELNRPPGQDWHEAVRHTLKSLDVVSGHNVRKGMAGVPASTSYVTGRALRRLYRQIPESRLDEFTAALLTLADDLRRRGVRGIAAATALQDFCDQMRRRLS